MNFIRNIISEKRSAKPQGAPLPSGGLDGRFDEVTKPDHTLAGPEANIFAGDDAGASDALLFDDELDAWVNAVDPQTAPAARTTAQSGMVDGAEAPVASAAPRSPVSTSTQGTYYLDAGAMRAAKPASPFDRPRTPDLARPDTKARPAPDLAPREPVEERRLRLAMLADDQAMTPADAPELAEQPAFSLAEPANQRTLNEMPYVSVQPVQPNEIITDAGLQVPPPAAGRGSSRSGRVKTRLLGFNPEGLSNPFEKAESQANDAFPVAWLVVVAGPGVGAAFALHDGVARIGRGEDQTVSLNFGDNSISRENHLSVAYDPEQNAFFIGQSGRSNIVRLNNKPLLSTEQVRSGDQIRVGETTLRLVTLCGDDFSWARKA